MKEVISFFVDISDEKKTLGIFFENRQPHLVGKLFIATSFKAALNLLLLYDELEMLLFRSKVINFENLWQSLIHLQSLRFEVACVSKHA